MLQEFTKHIDTQFSFLQEKRFLIAVSGGIDSVVLTYLCEKLKLDFALCHCNFQLRGDESEEDERFVKNLAHQLKKECFVTSFETQKFAEENKLSIQVAARDLRYQWFYELLEKESFSYVLTAHNTNDNLETFLINLTRGSGLEGFTGILPINKKSIRPLLAFSRDDITMFAIKNGIEWREDRSNANVKYVRNKVRHQIIPVLKEINPHLLDSFQNTLKYLHESQEIIEDRIETISEKVISKSNDNFFSIKIDQIKKLNNPKAYLYALLNEYGFTEWNDVVDLLDAQTGKQIVSKTHRLLKNRNELLLATLDKYQEPEVIFEIENDMVELVKPFRLNFEKTTLIKGQSRFEIIVDKDLLKFPLQVRKWIYGDYFCPVGMSGTKKISQLFKDKKLSLIDKKDTWLLANADNEIIWVVGIRQDRRTEISEKTKNKLKISVSL